MRSVIIALALLIGILMTIFISARQVDNIGAQLNAQLGEIEEVIATENWQQVQQQKEENQRLWGKIRPTLAIQFSHGELDQIELSFARLWQYALQQDKAAAMAELSTAQILAGHLAKKDCMMFQNIF